MAAPVNAHSKSEEQKRDYYESKGHVRVSGPLPSLLYFNADYGFLEAQLRGFRSGFVKEFEYRQLTQCQTLEDVKLTFGDTDYCNTLQNTSKLTPDIIGDRCWDKYVGEFQFLRDQATGALATFLDMITYEALISNISFLITGVIRGGGQTKSEELLTRCNPLGLFPTLKTVFTFENSSESDALVDLYRTVLVDTPVARYFEEYFNEELKSDEALSQLEQVYNEVEIDIITNRLQKFWLEDFYRYCKTLGGETWLMMKELLEFEADRRTISITINSFGTPLSETHDQREARSKLFPALGALYPEGQESLSDVTNEETLAERLKPYSTFARLYHSYHVSHEYRTFADALKAYEVHLNRLAFDSQSHFACFWAYGRLKQQEIRNIRWICSCIEEQRDSKDMGRWIKLF
jgi:V-type H+-transporting ATPase subunit d